MPDEAALAYAKRIALGLWERHWKADMPDWRPGETLGELLDTINAMSAGLDRVRPVCVTCGKTPQDAGRCEECGYNRNYRYEIVSVPAPH